MRVASSLIASWAYAEFLGCALTFLPIMGAVHATDRDPTRRRSGQWMRRFGRTTSALMPAWNFSVEGEIPKDVRERAFVVVANHESQADPFLLSWLPWDMRWVAKEELFKQPLIGWLMKFGGDIPIRRGQKDSVVEMMDECERTLRGGMSIMMFPEGTRSKTAELLPFKDGAFQLAVRAGVPILPIALAGTHAMRPKGSAAVRKARAIAHVLSPIETTGMTADDVPRLRDRAREVISAALPAVREKVGFHPPSGQAGASTISERPGPASARQ